MKQLKKFLCLFLTFALVLSLTSCTKKAGITELKANPVNLSNPEKREREKMDGDIFVSPNGDDKNNGEENTPVKTVQRAIELAKALSKEQKVIYFNEGEYNVSAVTLTKADNQCIF